MQVRQSAVSRRLCGECGQFCVSVVRPQSPVVVSNTDRDLFVEDKSCNS